MTKKIILLNMCVLLSGCTMWNWIVTDNPDAPPVKPNTLKPVVFKGSTNVTAKTYVYTFKLSPNDKESAWSDALAIELNGKREKSIKAGRIDVVTDDMAIEVERASKWHEGIGQALHYGLYENKMPALAIILPANNNQTMEVITRVCERYGINLILLMAE